MDYYSEAILGKREKQEDCNVISQVASDNSLIAIVSDGMGGHAAGEIASKIAVKYFLSAFNQRGSRPARVRLKASLDSANIEIKRSIQLNAELEGMGCTLVAAYISDDGLHWISVGDSLLLLFRSRRIRRINQDHSMNPVLEESVRSGKLSIEEANSHPHRHALRSAILGEDIPLIDASEKAIYLQKNDIIIVASDGILTLGLSGLEKILTVSKNNNANEICGEILKRVILINKPRQDNTTIQVIKIDDYDRGITNKKPVFLLAIVAPLFLALFTVIYFYQKEISDSFLDNNKNTKIEVVHPKPRSLIEKDEKSTASDEPSPSASAVTIPVNEVTKKKRSQPITRNLKPPKIPVVSSVSDKKYYNNKSSLENDKAYKIINGIADSAEKSIIENSKGNVLKPLNSEALKEALPSGKESPKVLVEQYPTGPAADPIVDP